MKKILILILLLLLTGCEKNEELKCENGTLEGDKCRVVETVEAIKECDSGYTYDKKTGKCNNSITIAAKQVSTCPKGYKIGNDNWCFSEETFLMEAKRTCVSDNIKDDDKFSSVYEKDAKCMEKICKKVSKDGKKCETFEEKQIPYKEEDVCPFDNMKKDDGICRKKRWMTKDFSCEIGELVEKKCIITDTLAPRLSCDKDFSLTKDGMCEKITFEAAS